MQTVSQAATVEYYLEMQESYRSSALYYSGGEEPDGVWWNPESLFGLDDGAVIEPDRFANLYNGLSPDGGQKLTRNAGSKNRSAGLDLTFSADKSISALWAMAEGELRESLEACHNDAARHALESVSGKYCAWSRRMAKDGKGGKNDIEVIPADIMGAMFQHGTSRENDPQLHTHCVIFNAARARDDGKWRALHQKPFYHWKMAGGAVYRNALAWNLRERLGVETEVYGEAHDRVRIAGIPEDLLQHWSKRRTQIVRAAAHHGATAMANPKLLDAVALGTRASKETDGSAQRRDARFRREAGEFVEREALVASLLGVCGVDIDEGVVRDVLRDVEAIPAELTVHEATFRLGDMVAHVANRTAGTVRPEALEAVVARLRGHEAVIEMSETDPRYPSDAAAGLAHTRLYSTLEEVGEEIEIGEMAVRMQARGGFSIESAQTEAMLEGIAASGIAMDAESGIAVDAESGIAIDGEQSRAVYHLVSDGALAVLEGAAGSGKTVALRPVAKLYAASGYRVLATAVAWRAALSLGTDCDAQPLAMSKLLRMAHGGKLALDARTVIMVDEAGMLSVRQTNRLLALAERTGAKVILVGEREQQQPVEAGPGLRLVVEKTGSASLRSIRRQLADAEDIIAHEDGVARETARLQASLMSADERAALLASREGFDGPVWQIGAAKAFRDQKARNAIQAYAVRGGIILERGPEQTMMRLVRDWQRYRDAHPEKSTLVMARTNAEVRELSELMRAVSLPEAGERHGVVIETSKTASGRGVKTSLEVACGDLLRIGATHWEKQLFNGTIVRVTGVAETGNARQAREGGPEETARRVRITGETERGRSVSFFADEITDYFGNVRLDYGYALTITSAQGATADRAFLLTDEHPARETIYPAATRHRDALGFYVDRRPLDLAIKAQRPEDEWDVPVSETDIYDHLGAAWSRDGSKKAGLDYASDEQRQALAEQVRAHREQRSTDQMTAMLRRTMTEPGRGPARGPARGPDSDVRSLLRRLGAWRDVFDEADVRRGLVADGVAREGVDAAIRTVLGHEDVVPLFGVDSTADRPLYTTVAAHARNQGLARHAAHLQTAVPPRAVERHARRIQRQASRYGLAAAHYELAGAVAATGGLTVVQTAEGAMRRGVLGTAADALVSDGTQVIGLGSGMRALKAFDQVPVQGMTIQAFLARLSAGEIRVAHDTVLMLADGEAVDADTMALLLKAAHQARLSLVVTGERHAVTGRGAAFDWLLDIHEARTSRQTSHRLPSHLAPDFCRGLGFARNGVWQVCYEEFAALGALACHDDSDAMRKRIVERWLETARSEGSENPAFQLVIARSNDEARALNAALHEANHSIPAGAGEGKTVRLKTVRPHYEPGSDRPTGITGIAGVTGDVTVRHSRPEALDVRKGDYLRLLAGDRASGLESGDIGRVVKVSPRRVVLDVDGHRVAFDPRVYQTFDLGYAVTPHQARSLTADRVHVVHDQHWHSAQAYSALTRTRSDLCVYSDGGARQGPADLAASIARTPVPVSTLAYGDRQSAILAEDGDLRLAWRGLDDRERVVLEEHDRDQWKAMEAVQKRAEDNVFAWRRHGAGSGALRLARATQQALSVRNHAERVVSWAERMATLQHHHLIVDTRALTAGTSMYTRPEYGEVLERWAALNEEGEMFLREPALYEKAFSEKTRFTLFDVARQRDQYRRERTAYEGHQQTLQQAAQLVQQAAREKERVARKKAEAQHDAVILEYLDAREAFEKTTDAHVATLGNPDKDQRGKELLASVYGIAERLHAIATEIEADPERWGPALQKRDMTVDDVHGQRSEYRLFVKSIREEEESMSKSRSQGRGISMQINIHDD